VKKQIKIGARTLGPKKAETLAGRKQNQEHKSHFKSGAVARTDPNAGRSGGGLVDQLSQVDSKLARRKKERS
jgi:hypothetical protein